MMPTQTWSLLHPGQTDRKAIIEKGEGEITTTARCQHLERSQVTGQV